ncbi:glycosyltransferase family 4 protein [Subtercola sp. RTI3]|uniref:glycosyltransferase family 4 protein n=1 Tax=Subtercola sp. RTI3 TaxID=3048639 RepID=UPI002B23C212|nr:glycosyltransferase family 4 protein [Subtercola sp. RTI3]MEA9986518.1 glycosyltransferase family 4 protein [Subtercola sp. RTI3]
MDTDEFRPTRVVVAYPQHVSHLEWATRYQQQLVPDAWPYGLNRLALEPAIELIGCTVKRPSLANTIRASFVISHGSGGSDTTAMAWDEMTAIQMMGQIPARTRMAGVIWATDPATGFKDRVKRYLSLRALKQLDGLWCLTKPQVEELEKLLGPDSPKIHHLPFGIDSDFFDFTPYPTTPLVVSAGGDRDRDMATLFEALEIVHVDNPGSEIIVQSSSNIEPPQGVTVIPRLSHSDLRQLYRRATVVAIATRHNNHASGMTVGLEAAATGRPVVATRTPGMNEYVANEATGLLVQPGDSKGFADSITHLLRNPTLAAQYGRDGRKKVEAGHTTALMARRLAQILLS